MEVAAALADDDTYDGYGVEEVPVLTDVRVELLWTEVSCSVTVMWDGSIAGDHLGEPTTVNRVHVGVEGEDDDRRTPPAPLTIERRATEHGYRLGVSLRVYGTDIERVRKVFTEQRAQLIAEPAVATIRAWVASDYLPRWTFGRDENHAFIEHLADALRAAGKGHLVETCIDPGS